MLAADLNRERQLGCEYEFSIPVVGGGGSHAAVSIGLRAWSGG